MNVEGFRKLIFLIKKYGLFLCIPIFLTIAYSFINASSTLYRVTAKIALKNGTADSAINDIKSRYWVQRTLDQLHFQVSYYDSLHPDKELSVDTLPVKLVFNRVDRIKQDVTLALKVTGAETFDLTHVDTAISLRFNEPIDEYFGRFSVAHSSGEKYKHASYTLKLHDPEILFSQFYNSLDVKVSGDKILTLSVTSEDARKSVAFLDKLILLYCNRAIFMDKELPKNLDRAKSEQMKLLTGKAASIKSMIEQLSAIDTASKISRVVKPVDSKQLKIYQVIKPYVEAPARQFVQVPYTDEVNDTRLRKMLDQYNALELKKQHILADKRNDSAVILQADNDLVAYRNAIIPVLNQDKQNPIGNVNRLKIADSLKTLRSSLATVRNVIQALKKEPLPGTGASLPVKGGVIVLESAKDNIETLSVNQFWVYALAIIAGLLIPIVWWVIREPRGNILPSNLFNAQKLIERINDLFAVKQID